MQNKNFGFIFDVYQHHWINVVVRTCVCISVCSLMMMMMCIWTWSPLVIFTILIVIIPYWYRVQPIQAAHNRVIYYCHLVIGVFRIHHQVQRGKFMLLPHPQPTKQPTFQVPTQQWPTHMIHRVKVFEGNFLLDGSWRHTLFRYRFFLSFPNKFSVIIFLDWNI